MNCGYLLMLLGKTMLLSVGKKIWSLFICVCDLDCKHKIFLTLHNSKIRNVFLTWPNTVTPLPHSINTVFSNVCIVFTLFARMNAYRPSQGDESHIEKTGEPCHGLSRKTSANQSYCYFCIACRHGGLCDRSKDFD